MPLLRRTFQALLLLALMSLTTPTFAAAQTPERKNTSASFNDIVRTIMERPSTEDPYAANNGIDNKNTNEEKIPQKSSDNKSSGSALNASVSTSTATSSASNTSTTTASSATSSVQNNENATSTAVLGTTKPTETKPLAPKGWGAAALVNVAKKIAEINTAVIEANPLTAAVKEMFVAPTNVYQLDRFSPATTNTLYLTSVAIASLGLLLLSGLPRAVVTRLTNFGNRSLVGTVRRRNGTGTATGFEIANS